MSADWHFNTDEWYIESKQFRIRLNEISDYPTRRDLYKLYHYLDFHVTYIVREQAECRLLGRQSDYHKRLIITFDELYENFIEYMTLGLLS